MKKIIFTFLTVISIASMAKADNVFFSDFKTTNGAVPFDKITNSDYEPAVLRGIEEQNAEINKIVNNPESPTFKNTIVAFENTGATLTRVLGVFYPLCSANADEELQDISQKLSPILSEHSTSITLNEGLWKRIKYVFDNCDRNALDQEDKMLLEKVYNSFMLSGAGLEGKDRDEYRQLSSKLASLTLTFEQNALKEVNRLEMWLTDADLEGLPESAVEAAKEAAAEKGRAGEYLVTPHAPSYMAFMKYSSRRDLREKLYMLYNTRNTSGEFNNIPVMQEIANTRRKIAALFGYDNFADFQLKETMVENSATVYSFLDQLRKAYVPAQKKEIKELTEFASKLEGKKMILKPWDYSYYANKLKDSKFELNDELLRPYFELNKVINGVLGLATRMYGLHFTENFDAQVYHPEVRVFNVTDETGNFVGLLYADFFPRATKQSGAWMTCFREQYINEQGKDVRPLVTVTTNFTRPTDTKPSLLTYYEVETFMHEFGHALHGLLAQSKYASLSGTNVYHDFVELPSQFNENFLPQKEFLNSFATHYQTGEVIPQDLIDKIIASSQFAAAYSCVRQLNFGYIDMAWHSSKDGNFGDPYVFENNAIKDVQIFEPIDGCIMSPQFTHIFSGGYAAGYYGYKWAEMLEADAFAKFLEDGIFNIETAHSFRDNILKRGASEHPMNLYVKFREKKPTIDALLKRDGIIK